MGYVFVNLDLELVNSKDGCFDFFHYGIANMRDNRKTIKEHLLTTAFKGQKSIEIEFISRKDNI